MQDYFGMVKCIDDNMGKLIEFLKAEGLYENTVVVFTSDHGDLMGEHARHNKGVPYEGSAAVAFVIAGPGVAQGKVVGAAMDMTDFGPSMLALLGSKGTMKKAHGRDVSELLKTGEVPDGWSDIAFMRSTSKLDQPSNWLAAVSDRWKLVVSPHEVPWLFDLQEDPFELQNMAKNQPERVGRMAAELHAWLKKTNDPALESEKYRNIFKSLGVN